MVQTTQGNCYICGVQSSKIAMKNHILKFHNEESNVQDCYLLKVEGIYEKDYWLYIDLPVNKTLSDVDDFLREIWLECCEHMSGFYDSQNNEISMNSKVSKFAEGSKLWHIYDFGNSTETLITFVARIKRPRQKECVRLLARNIPKQYQCTKCGKPAEYFCLEELYDADNPYYCEICEEECLEDTMITITNSPRMGQCVYDGMYDIYTFEDK